MSISKNSVDKATHGTAQMLAEYCRKNITLNVKNTYHYQSLSVCVIDCIYSLRARYEPTTINVVKRYADQYLMDRNADDPNDTLSALVNRVKTCGPEAFAENVLANRQKLSGKNKCAVCLELAEMLLNEGIDTIDDFRRCTDESGLERKMLQIHGIGKAATNYLFMLAGDSNRCKPDVHIHQCIVDVCGKDVSDEECQKLFTEAAAILKKDYPALTVRALDASVWEHYSKLKKASRVSG